MFWKIKFKPTSAIDGLLDKEDCTLNEILDEDDVLQEIKNQNKKLIEFVLKPENMEQLLNYVCIDAGPDMDEKYKFKYPHLACEILTADVFAIVEMLCTSEKYIPTLWQFLYEEPPLNPLLGSFISKVLNMLLTQRTVLFLDYIQKIEGFVDKFLQHLGTSAMMDLLLQMVVAPDNDQNRLNVALWLIEEDVVNKLLDFIKSSADINRCVNSSQALCDIINISREMSGPSPLLETLESEDTISRLLDNMFEDDEPPDWVIINGTSVLLTTLDKRNSYSPTFGRSSFSTQPPPAEDTVDQNLDKVLTSLTPRIINFHKLLFRKPQCEPMSTTFGLLDPPLGNMRLQVVRLFSALLHTHDSRIQKEIIINSTCTVLIDLFFKYPWNNFLHTQVESCIVAALSSTAGITLDLDSGTGQANDSSSLRQHLLVDCKLVQRLLEGAELNDMIVNEKEGSRQGYMGHLVRMANQIAGNTRALGIGGMLDQTRDREEIAMAIIDDERLQSELDDETYKKWSDFIAGPVAEMNKRNDTNLGGSRPLTSSIDDSDDDFEQMHMGPDNELEKAFQQYQDSRFSSNFMEEFGLDDDLDPAPIPYSSTYTTLTSIACHINADEIHTQYMAGFEAACSERIQQFDDSESEDEDSSPWVEKEIMFASLGPRSPTSTSDDEDDEDNGKRQREYPTESSDDDDSLSERRERLVIIEEKPVNKSDDGVITWKSEFSTDEDLSVNGVTSVKSNTFDWTQEPVQQEEQKQQRNDENWADFSVMTYGKSEVKEDNPRVVTVTYVSIKEIELEDTSSTAPQSVAASNPYIRLASDDSIGSNEGDDNMFIDHNLLEMSKNLSESGDDEDTTGSSDDEKLGNSCITSEGDSGNPLLDSSADSSLETDNMTNDTAAKLIDNYKFLTNQGLMSGNHNATKTDKHKEVWSEGAESSSEIPVDT